MRWKRCTPRVYGGGLCAVSHTILRFMTALWGISVVSRDLEGNGIAVTPSHSQNHTPRLFDTVSTRRQHVGGDEASTDTLGISSCEWGRARTVHAPGAYKPSRPRPFLPLLPTPKHFTINHYTITAMDLNVKPILAKITGAFSSITKLFKKKVCRCLSWY